MTGTNLEELLQRRTSLFQKKWWLEQPTVQNQEWLYLLEEETRNSIMIEWYFSDKKTLTEVISWKKNTSEHADKITWYFDAASLIYEFAYQKHIDNISLEIQSYDIKTIHSLMFKLIDPAIWGKRRSWNMIITGAKIQPLFGCFIEEGIKYLIRYIQLQKNNLTLVQLLARFHVLFEAIHPFEDGNGRVWRILINYILVSQWYPNIIIKGTDRAKKQYFDALESWEKWLYTIFPDNIPTNDRDKQWDFLKMEKIIYHELFQTLDIMILANDRDLKPLTQICIDYGYSDEYARKLVKRGQVIAKKIWNTRYSSLDYFQKPLTQKN